LPARRAGVGSLPADEGASRISWMSWQASCVFLSLQRVRRADPLHRDAPEISAGARSSANSGGMGMPSRPWPREAPPKQYRADLAPADGTAHQPPSDGRARRLYPPEPGSGEELSRD